MAGLSIHQLPWPASRYRVDLHSPNFESEDDATAEDGKRARSARAQADNHGGEWGERAAELAEILDPDLHSHLPSTPASFRYFREQRIRICSDLYRLVTEEGDGSYFRADVIKPGWACDLEGLHNLNPRRLLRSEFRADAHRVLSPNAKKRWKELAPAPPDFMFAALHGEFDQLAQRFQPHVHVGGTGVYVDVVDRLRGLKGYRTTHTVRTPIRITRNIYDLPGAITYLLKGYWPQRPALPLGSNGGLKRPRKAKAQRINEPYHTDLLLWLDRWELSDLVLMMGLRVGKHGFTLT